MSLPDPSTAHAPRAIVFGCSGNELTADEASFFAAADPLGFILFARNCETPDQVRALTAALRDCVGRGDAPVLIDQEGGTVRRLRPPHWHDVPPAARFGALYRRDVARGLAATRIAGELIGAELAALGVDVNCAPVLDLHFQDTTAAIGERSYGGQPDEVAALGEAFCEGLLAEGVLPIIKHLPGHGRARSDSHRVLPHVSADADVLRAADFLPFKVLAGMPCGMTAHVAFDAFDPGCAGTVSSAVIDGVIRGEIGFRGFLFSDDIVMSALEGSMSERAQAALVAGCDAVLHCSGNMAEMNQLAGVVPPLGETAQARWQAARARCQMAVGRPGGANPEDLAARLGEAMQTRKAG